MRTLALETSTPHCGVAITHAGEVAAEALLATGRNHSEVLLPLAEDLLARLGLGWRDLDLVAVCRGPGSFIGLRVGLSTAQGIAAAAEVPLVGVAALDALAENVSPTGHLLCPALDVRRGEVYTGLYRKPSFAEPEVYEAAATMKPETLAARLQSLLSRHAEQEGKAPRVLLLGSGAATYREMLSHALGEAACFAPSPWGLIRPGALALLAEKRFQGGQDTAQSAQAGLIYARGPVD